MLADNDFISISDMLKATPRVEGGRRFLYIEASNEKVDQQGEVVLQQALRESSDYFLQFGNLDIDHFTIIGPKLGIPDYLQYEIGRPVDVRFNAGKTFVKGEVFQGDTPIAAKANEFWASLVDLRPPQRWYPSVGGKVLGKQPGSDKGGMPRTDITKVRWYNIGFSKTPVNSNVPEVSAVPMDVFAKCWGPSGLDVMMLKALTAGYGTDAATATGGAALRIQSLDGTPVEYFDLRDRLSQDMLTGKVPQDPGLADLVSYSAKTFHLADDVAAEFVERFARDIRDGIKKATAST
jgi:hypothetical protein